MIITLGTTPTVQKTLTFNRVTIDAVNRATSVHHHASGKAINVARVLRVLGEPCLALGFVGGDPGKFIRHDLSTLNIQHDFVEVEPPTRTCTTLLDRENETATELVEEAADVPVDAYETLFNKLRQQLTNAKVLVLAGTLTPNAPADFYGRCVQAAVEAKVPVILDAKGPPLEKALGRKPTVIKPNLGELEHTVGRALESQEAVRSAVRELIALGPQWAVITAGSKPTVVSDGKQFWTITGPKLNALNPIGSGDSFNAGLAAGVARGQSMLESARLGMACGAANALTQFAGHVKLEDVQRLLDQIHVSE